MPETVWAAFVSAAVVWRAAEDSGTAVEFCRWSERFGTGAAEKERREIEFLTEKEGYFRACPHINIVEGRQDCAAERRDRDGNT